MRGGDVAGVVLGVIDRVEETVAVRALPVIAPPPCIDGSDPEAEK
jgi:hypothetical protein